jgi:hypothetical protein
MAFRLSSMAWKVDIFFLIAIDVWFSVEDRGDVAVGDGGDGASFLSLSLSLFIYLVNMFIYDVYFYFTYFFCSYFLVYF